MSMSPITFGKVKTPCGDCWDGHCTMNCSPRERIPDEPAEASDHDKLMFLAGEVRKALACFDRMPLQQYFDQCAAGDPIALAVLGAFDHLSPALNVLGLTNASGAPSS
jgi:hypothetical protein